MQSGAETTQKPRSHTAAHRPWSWLLLSNLLIALGCVIVVAAAAYAGFALLHNWLAGQDRYLAVDAAAVPISEVEWVAADAAAPTSQPESAAAPSLGATATARPAAAGTPRPGSTPALTPVPSPTPAADTEATPTPAAAVRIRIPAIRVDRSIIELPLAYDARTKTWTRDVKRLFRKAGKDLVGHWGGSAQPGQDGNLILVGHNYGYGVNGVFVRLGSLKAGHKVYVIDAAGTTHTYQVKSVHRVPWRLKNAQEAARNQALLEVPGPERLTLVTCGGAVWAPYPQRLYVVAYPVP